MTEAAALLALTLDAALGWPVWLHARTGHPVGAFARLIATCDVGFNRPDRSDAQRRLFGGATLLLLIGTTGVAGYALEAAAHRIAGSFAWVVIALLAWPGLAQRSLYDHYCPILIALQNGDLTEARRAVGMIVGRDTAVLKETGVARAAIESLAESFCDGIAAPLFWFLIFGLPGLWLYKAINTADSLIGHKEEPYTAFGMVAARTDDAMNFIPARLAALLICLAGGGGWRVLWRDHGKHASPNAGWPEAAMAGALGVRLAGPAVYGGHRIQKPWIGTGTPPGIEAMMQARLTYLRACGIVWILAGAIAWVR